MMQVPDPAGQPGPLRVVRRGPGLTANGRRPRRIRIPLLLDVVIADDLADIVALNENRHLVRAPQDAGPLLNRLVARAVARAFAFDAPSLPTFTERGDGGRARRQQALEAQLTRRVPELGADDLDVAALADYVGGRGHAGDIGVVVQGIVGRLFDPGYRANTRTYQAARLVTRYPRALPPVAWWWRWSGKLRRSQQILARAAGGDPIAIHATTITIHNIVDTLTRMRKLAAAAMPPASTADAVAIALTAPPVLIRWCTARAHVPGVRAPLRVGTVVMLRLGRAHDERRDAGSPFLVGEWNQCPAWAFVMRLLERAWEGRQVRR